MASLRPASSWLQDLPSRPFGEGGFGGSDYELYEEDEEFVLAIDVPGFDVDDVTLAWDEGMLNVAAEHVDDDRGRTRTYHRRFRFPKEVDAEEITAEYTNGVLEVRLPIAGTAVVGREIPVEA